MGPSALKGQLFVALFFCLTIANVIFSHSIGREFVSTAQQIRAVERVGGDPEQEVPVAGQSLNAAHLMLFTNLPFFGALGLIVRAEEPTMGFIYWVSMVFGGILLPLFVTICFYLMLHPPSHPSTHFVTDDPIEEDPFEDDNDQQRR